MFTRDHARSVTRVPRSTAAQAGGSVVSGGPVTIAPELLDSLVTIMQAANLADVRVSAISNWKDRGHLGPAMHDGRGRPLYRWIDVARAERKTREHARRTFPTRPVAARLCREDRCTEVGSPPRCPAHTAATPAATAPASAAERRARRTPRHDREPRLRRRSPARRPPPQRPSCSTVIPAADAASPCSDGSSRSVDSTSEASTPPIETRREHETANHPTRSLTGCATAGPAAPGRKAFRS